MPEEPAMHAAVTSVVQPWAWKALTQDFWIFLCLSIHQLGALGIKGFVDVSCNHIQFDVVLTLITDFIC